MRVTHLLNARALPRTEPRCIHQAVVRDAGRTLGRILVVCLTFVSLHMPTLTLAQTGALPALGDGEEMTVAAERRLGDRIARELYRDPDYIDDPVLMDYLQSLWQPLLAAARARGDITPDMQERLAFELLMGRDRTVNAFALPGAYFGVQLGLIGFTTTRDELASVLAHELSHVTQRHIARLTSQQKQVTPLLIGAMILGALAASKSPDAAGALITGGQAAAVQSQLNFSRDMEREADRLGLSVLIQAGFDAMGFVTMFDKLGQATRLSDSGAFPYLRTHPLSTERLSDMQSRMQIEGLLRNMQAASVLIDLEHALMTARARSLSAGSADAQRVRQREADALMGPQERSPDTPAEIARQAGVLYSGVLAAQRLGDGQRARAYLPRLRTLVGSQAAPARLVLMLELELALQQGDLALCAALADRLASSAGLGQSRPPAGTSRSVLLLWAQAMIRTQRAPEITQALQVWTVAQPRDAGAWELLSQALAAQGQTLRAVRAEAEAFVARRNYAAAMDRFRSAQDLTRTQSPVDHIEASIIDTRARQVESLRREQALER